MMSRRNDNNPINDRLTCDTILQITKYESEITICMLILQFQYQRKLTILFCSIQALRYIVQIQTMGVSLCHYGFKQYKRTATARI